MCSKAVLETGRLLESVPVCYKNCQICDKTYDNYPHALKLKKKKKCVIKLSILTFLQYHLFLNAIRLREFLIKLLALFFPFDFVPNWSRTQERNL